MKRKIWLIFFPILVILGVYMLTHAGAGVSMQTEDGYDTVAEYESDASLFSEFGKDLKHFFTIGADLFRVIGGGESRFDNGIAALTGGEDIDAVGETASMEEPEENADAIRESAPTTVAEQMAEKKADSSVQLVKASVDRVVDGDTFYAFIGETELKIRLIGVDTPESVHADDSKNTVWGTYASDYTKTILQEGTTVYLEYDEEPTDKYGRTLAYVWLSEDTSDFGNMLNAVLVRDGYAYDKMFRPNVKYADLFEKLRISAQDSGTGLWADEGFAALWEG